MSVSFLLALFLASAASSVFAQGGGTTVSGTITDSQSAVIQNAKVTIKDLAAGTERSAMSSTNGQYGFGNVLPGTYEIRVEATGFARVVAARVTVDVAIGVTQDFKLEVGSVTTEIVVTGSQESPLQTTDSSIGNVIREDSLRKLPNLNRQAGSLLAFQPGATNTGEVTGARNDQTSIVLDGTEVSDTVIGASFRTVVPTPTESIEEYRVIVANPNATLGRGSGAQTVVATKRGGNDFHGSAYEFLQNEDLNANVWQLNRTGQKRPVLRDNRYGASLGGPILKNRTFFYVHYEGRRQQTNTSVTRVVPSDSLRQGILRFRDAAGEVVSFDPKTVDPRGLGANAAMLKVLNLYPKGNDPSAGTADGLNTIGFLFSVSTPVKNEFGVLRLDHKINDKWSFDGSARFARELATNAGQIDTIHQTALYNTPSRPHSISGALNGVLTPRITNRFQYSWLHDRLSFTPQNPVPITSDFNVAIAPGSAQTNPFLNAPVDVDTQRARTQYRVLNYHQFGDSLNWQKGSHLVQAGFTIRNINSVDFRNDKVIGSISTPVADIAAGQFNVIPDTQRPAFLRAADVSRYNQFYSTLLGLVNQVPVLRVRDSALQPLPIGSGLLTHSTLQTYEFFGQDTWKISRSLTLSYGISYQWQTPPKEADKHQTVLALASNPSQLIDPASYFNQKFSSAAKGEIYNPDLAYIPLAKAGRDTPFNIDRSNFSPRVSMAWNPRFDHGLKGKLFGDGKTVFRGGYALLYDRTNTVGTIIVPTLGVGFAQTVSVLGPKNGAGQPFRAGLDGPIPTPAFSAATSPIIPADGFSEILSFSVDPNIRVPKNHAINFTMQRELPGNFIVEVSYIGRFARGLFQNEDLNSAPYNFKDSKSGQTFAQAFDAVANQLRANVAPSKVTAQPWFDNQLPGVGTTGIAAAQTTAFINGNVSDLFQTYMDFVAPKPFDNRQVLTLFQRVTTGLSNYHGGVLTVTKRFSQGLSFQANYTYSKSLDQVGLNQNNVGVLATPLNPYADYGPSFFDRRHIFSSTFVYDLPFGKGKRFMTAGNSALQKIVGGWYLGGIMVAQSGLPLSVAEGSGQVFGGSDVFGNVTGAIPLAAIGYGSGVHGGVAGGNGIGTSGNPATGGSGLNLFGNPETVFANFRPVNIATDGRLGRGVIRGLSNFNLDMSLGKSTVLRERLKLGFSMEAFNVLNHPIFNDPSLSLQTTSSFGVITSQNTGNGYGPRRLQAGIRLDW